MLLTRVRFSFSQITSIHFIVDKLSYIFFCCSQVYHRIAIYLTNLENPRTQTEYEDSYTFKIFFFEFMNYYSSLIYIAFFKGRFYEHPGDAVARKSEFYKLKGNFF